MSPALRRTIAHIAAASAAIATAAAEYLLVEEFDGPELNSDMWEFNYGDGSQFGMDGWGNGEQQWYVDDPRVVYTKDGLLNIDLVPGSKIGMDDKRIVAGKITSRTGFKFTYGRVDVRLRLKSAVDGLFPAVWMMPKSSTYGGWPKSGEIDIFEFSRNWSPPMSHALHFEEHHGGDAISFKSASSNATEWQIFSVVWTETQITFLWNGTVSGTYYRPADYTSFDWPYNHDFYFILNFAAEPRWSRKLPDDFQSSGMQIDYIRVAPLDFCPQVNVTEPPCVEGWRSAPYHDIMGHNIPLRKKGTDAPKDCQTVCDETAGCDGYSWSQGYCFYKTGPIQKCFLVPFEGKEMHSGYRCLRCPFSHTEGYACNSCPAGFIAQKDKNAVGVESCVCPHGTYLEGSTVDDSYATTLHTRSCVPCAEGWICNGGKTIALLKRGYNSKTYTPSVPAHLCEDLNDCFGGRPKPEGPPFDATTTTSTTSTPQQQQTKTEEYPSLTSTAPPPLSQNNETSARPQVTVTDDGSLAFGVTADFMSLVATAAAALLLATCVA